jgi:hypothetical protein
MDGGIKQRAKVRALISYQGMIVMVVWYNQNAYG